MNRYSLSRKAEEDLEQINEYTLELWGEEQAIRYFDELLHCFELLLQTPGIGRFCHSISSGLQRVEQGKHIIFYRTSDKGIEIVRILHQKRSPSKLHFLDA